LRKQKREADALLAVGAAISEAASENVDLCGWDGDAVNHHVVEAFPYERCLQCGEDIKPSFKRAFCAASTGRECKREFFRSGGTIERVRGFSRCNQ